MNLKQYDKQLDGILDGIQSQIEECNAKIEAAQTALDKAEADKTAALRAGNDAAYNEAREAIDKAEASLIAATTRMSILKNGPLIGVDEYESTVSGILDEMTQLNNADKREAVKLCEKLLTIANRNLSMIEEGDKLLHKLQYDVYRAADIPRDKSGEIILDWSGRRDKQFTDNNSLNGWAQYALRECVQYTALRDSITV